MSQISISDIARQVISTEANALHLLAKQLPSDFPNVVDAILKVPGRVIVSGVGKSGHIGRKISATLASTGTPANFVHATEASHGDLGMITADDFCLLISNSGETVELSDIVAHSSRFGIPMAAISSNPGSTLMNAANFKLTLPRVPEACSIGMAPTTSTTLTLALGDGLAVALMKKRDFQPADFKMFHPGGKLGAKMSTVSQLMRPVEEMAIMSSGASMTEVILKMTETGYGLGVIVNEDLSVAGVISDGDLRRNAQNLLDQVPVSIATENPISVASTDLIETALNRMQENKVYSILVVDNLQPVGLLRLHDLLRAGIA